MVSEQVQVLKKKKIEPLFFSAIDEVELWKKKSKGNVIDEDTRREEQSKKGNKERKGKTV